MATDAQNSGQPMAAGPNILEGLSHGNIGNYKGVMLCNRPNEPGELPMRDRYF